MTGFKSFLHNVASQYKVEENNFEKAFFYFFGLVDNPFDKAVKEIYAKSVNDAVKQDWEVVLNDFKRVFNKEVETIDVKE